MFRREKRKDICFSVWGNSVNGDHTFNYPFVCGGLEEAFFFFS